MNTNFQEVQGYHNHTGFLIETLILIPNKNTMFIDCEAILYHVAIFKTNTLIFLHQTVIIHR